MILGCGVCTDIFRRNQPMPGLDHGRDSNERFSLLSTTRAWVGARQNRRSRCKCTFDGVSSCRFYVASWRCCADCPLMFPLAHPVDSNPHCRAISKQRTLITVFKCSLPLFLTRRRFHVDLTPVGYRRLLFDSLGCKIPMTQADWCMFSRKIWIFRVFSGAKLVRHKSW